MMHLVSHVARRAAPIAAVVLVSAALVAAPAHAQSAVPSQAPAADTTARLKPVVVTAVPGLSDSMRVELAGHLADSATLAKMSQRDRVLRLAEDNRYLVRVTRSQDKRIDALEKRIRALGVERKQLRAQQAAPEESADSVVKSIKMLQLRLDSLERVRKSNE